MTTHRIVMVSDTHDSHDALFDMPKGDILLVAGDFTYNGTELELERFNDWLDEQDYAFKCVIPGNHDFSFERRWDWACSKVPAADAILNQEVVVVNGIKIWGEPRQPEFFDWAFNVPRPLMKEVWEKVPTDIDILLTHGPPAGLLDRTPRGDDVGCVHQRAWIEEHQPRLVVCGHIHDGYGLALIGNTLVVNAAVCNEQYKPVNAPVVLDFVV